MLLATDAGQEDADHACLHESQVRLLAAGPFDSCDATAYDSSDSFSCLPFDLVQRVDGVRLCVASFGKPLILSCVTITTGCLTD